MNEPVCPTETSADPRLQRLLGAEALAPLRQRLRKRFERHAPHDAAEPLDAAEPKDATEAAGPRLILLKGLSPAEREALALLSGQPVRLASQSLKIDVPLIDQQLRRAGLAHSLRDALERLDGPIVSARAEREALQRRWQVALAQVLPGNPLHRWLQEPASQHLLRRLARQPEQAQTLLADAARVLQHLPCSPQPRSRLAAEVLGDAHALDDGRPVATLVLAAWRHHEQNSAQTPADTATPTDDTLPPPDATAPTDDALPDPDALPEGAPIEERQRDIWARAGVLVNELARPALCLNLPASPGSLPAAAPGEPFYLSLRQLLRNPPAWQVTDRAVHVCENPNMLAIIADRLGAQSPPLVCTDGMPAAAQRTLLDQLRHAGARLHYHGDFDWPGIRIANHVLSRWHAQPWRMQADDYERAVRQAAPSSPRLQGEGPTPCWDPHLQRAMQHHRLAIAEEAVAEELIRDLTLSLTAAPGSLTVTNSDLYN